MRIKPLMMLGAVMLSQGSLHATDYYVSPTGAGAKDGTSWADAIDFDTWYAKMGFGEGCAYADGDVFHLEGGHYYVPAAIKRIGNAYTIIGGYDPATHAAPAYPASGSAATVIDGDRDRDGAPGPADAERCFSVQTGTKAESEHQKPVRIIGIDFVNMHDAKGTKTHGAVQVNNSYDVTIANCRFAGNTTDYSTGGMAITNHRSTIFVTDCEFTANSAGNRGGAVFVSSDDKSKGLTVIERCSFVGNRLTSDGADGRMLLGSAICYTNGPGLWIVNSTVAGNEALSGGAVYVTGADATWKRQATIVSSTIAGNRGGCQLSMTQGACLRLANSYVVGHADDGTVQGAAIAVTGPEERPEFFSVVSAGHNVIGAYANEVAGATAVPSWHATDSQGQANVYPAVFGDSGVEGGVVRPVAAVAGADAQALSADLAGWGPEAVRVDLSVDQLGNPRLPGTTGGACAVEAGGVSSVASGMAAARPGSAPAYTLGGLRAVAMQKGRLYISGGKKVAGR